MLGIQLQGEQLRIAPRIAKDWPGFQVTYLHRRKQVSRYEIAVENPEHVCGGLKSVELDGQNVVADAAITLLDDGKNHSLRIVLG